MGDESTRVVDDHPHRQGRGRSIPLPGSGEDVQGHSLRPSDEPVDPMPRRHLPDIDDDDVEGHRFLGPKNALK